MKPHKHAEVIKAWADGAQIQFRNVTTEKNWTDLPFCSPSWYETVEYRIKPDPKPEPLHQAAVFYLQLRCFVDKDGKILKAEVV